MRCSEWCWCEYWIRLGIKIAHYLVKEIAAIVIAAVVIDLFSSLNMDVKHNFETKNRSGYSFNAEPKVVKGRPKYK